MRFYVRRKPVNPRSQYGITAGETNLRKLTAGHLRKLDGADDRVHSFERVMITGGSQQLLYMTLEALCDEGDIILVEDPTYFVFLSILQSQGIRARGVRLERDGIDLTHLQTVLEQLQKSGELRRVKAIYFVSYFQNPTGVTTNFAKKSGAMRILKKFERAAGHPIYLIEDAAYRELRFAGDYMPSALTVPGAANRVIYTGTYSKPFATGARVGFGVLPEPVFTDGSAHQGQSRFRHCELGATTSRPRIGIRRIYNRHVAKIQKRYGKKARVMKQAMAKHFPPDVEIWESGGGLYFWARLPKNVPTGLKSKVFQTALRNDVLYVPGGICYADDPSRRKPGHEMRISFGSASEADIREGIKRLGKVLRQFI